MKPVLILIFSLALSFNLYSQCYPDRHSTARNAGWTSCEMSANPNTQRGTSHWIMYNLNIKYPLGILNFWNHNHPDELDYGIKNIVIDISNDGQKWTEVARYEVPMANASGFYEGQEGPNLNGYEARFLLITALDNYGGECYSLGEIRVGLSNVPDPCVNQEMVIDNTPIYDGAYDVIQHIDANGLVNETGEVSFKAGNSISLNPGFTVEIGADFTADISPCN